ncbi:TPA: undecaprenyldiphospho-muramoylpentapeptide beta-N-acetylglucosaminyltransferase [Patescibacteria group bacterium]|nr:MAG: UDP diphospho-muramoyl pentapeptide beta-N acetylglucosaminyl transferase [Parcubacteria group bacterium GW2011_GWA2_40_143]KKR60011.1 MAG: UDP diphospho-muramoyl pentapeptide beta-N acetylglucosaminyl transferase [Parcubacteria group bacterium GW2011_GWC2_40_31]KKR75545.1 MAG: UDP diphospho-muramoyl pentapeptide beta-N acetylglucosaminyl transferase [Parcubacteria group bacterium GW2011_GWB2_40_8]KKR77651.1 MAG: UDP diphospho-muramoyl pentapeptide beta-N acetylglucosaminyl transferase [
MKILLTGGGTGGHFYPLMAVAEALNSSADKEKIAKMEMVFMAEDPYDKDLLLKNGIKFKKVYSGKLRRYFSLLNIIDLLKIIPGILKAIISIYFDFPDVVFSKGGHESLPALFAARFLGIPVVIHESDTVPGKANKWASRFAKRIAISFPDSVKYFKDQSLLAVTGNPIRKEFFIREKVGAREFLMLEASVPTVFIIGGSQGAMAINETVLDILPELVQNFQIIHQCGPNNLSDTKARTDIVLADSDYQSRYRLFGTLNLDAMRMAYGAADLVISRAGSSSIFEIAASGLPSIMVPLDGSAQDHQRENAYAYARGGAAVVIEQRNLAPHILKSEIERLLNNYKEREKMSEAAAKFAKPLAAETIAREIIKVAINHK